MAMPDVLLISCYSLGHQPLGIAWPKAFLERAGFAPDSLDLAVEPWDDAKVRRAKLVAIAVPMHTALRLGVRTAERIRRANPQCRIVFHGLYALLNADDPRVLAMRRGIRGRPWVTTLDADHPAGPVIDD